jgi:cardiolipin synthase (CMP-forming)
LAKPPVGGDARSSPGDRRQLTFKRLVGLDRSGGPPEGTRRGEALHPWTIPNAIGFARLALIPVFLVVAFESDDGRSWLACALFAFIAGTDYLDGMVARITGQYSRLGALLDPLTDRLLVLSGAIVAWHFELLPRWALALLAAREAFMLVLTEVALRRGIDLNVNMVGRWAVWPVMAALGLALVWDSWVPEALLYLGIVLTLAATALYLQDGVRALREGSTST